MQPLTPWNPAPQPNVDDGILNAQRRSWNTYSPGWATWDAFTMRFLEPQGAAILAAIDPDDSASVLDIATGTGDPGLTLASRRPDVQVTALDASEGMLRIARSKARARHVDNFRTAVGDACALDFADDSFDAVSCRLGFMFFPNLQVAAHEMARVVRPGGLVATTVWTGPGANSWLTTIVGAIKKHIEVPSPPQGAPGLFRCASPDVVPGLFAEAGLKVERTEELAGQMTCRSSEEYWQFMNAVVPPVVSALGSAPADTVAKVKSEVFAALDRSTASDRLTWGASCVVARKDGLS